MRAKGRSQVRLQHLPSKMFYKEQLHLVVPPPGTDYLYLLPSFLNLVPRRCNVLIDIKRHVTAAVPQGPFASQSFADSSSWLQEPVRLDFSRPKNVAMRGQREDEDMSVRLWDVTDGREQGETDRGNRQIPQNAGDHPSKWFHSIVASRKFPPSFLPQETKVTTATFSRQSPAYSKNPCHFL